MKDEPRQVGEISKCVAIACSGAGFRVYTVKNSIALRRNSDCHTAQADATKEELAVDTIQKAQGGKGPARKVVQTAGRDALGDFAPDFARYNDDVLFGEVWSKNDVLSLHDRSIVTVSALVASGVTGPLKYHIATAKENGVTKEEMVEVLTQLAFYAGWPKAWAAFPVAKEVYGE